MLERKACSKRGRVDNDDIEDDRKSTFGVSSSIRTAARLEGHAERIVAARK